MSKIKKVFKPIAKIINKIPGGSFIGPIVAGAFGGPLAAAGFSAANTIGRGGSLLQGLMSGAGSYFGGKFGGNVLGNMGTVGNSLVNNFGNMTGNTIANSLGSLAGTSISSGLGGFAGNAIANQVSGFDEEQAAMANAPKPVKPFSPSMQDEMALPGSLSGSLGSLNANQRSSNLANQGTYGGGLGPDEQKYFLNLMNRRLVDKSGQTSDMGGIQPIESSYLQKLGLGGYKDSRSLLEAMSKWQGV